MKKRQWALGLTEALLVLYLIFCSRRALSAGRDGIALCLKTVIPSLFPFFVLARLLAGSPVAAGLCRLLAPFTEKVFHLPRAAAPALVLGALGGYPTGAQTAALLYRQGRLTAKEAEQALSFCSNAGPGFVFGLLGGVFGMTGSALLLAVHLFSAGLVGYFLRDDSHTPPPDPGPIETGGVTLPQALKESLLAMGSVCGYVTLFGILSDALAFGGQGALPQGLTVVLQGILELTGGCAALSSLAGSPRALALAGFFLSFGGVCVLCQTKSVILPAGLTGNRYLRGKLMQAVFSALLLLPFGGLFPPQKPLETANTGGNHQGLLAATAWVALGYVLLFLFFALHTQKKYGKKGGKPDGDLL